MSEAAARAGVIISRVRNNPLIAALILAGLVAIGAVGLIVRTANIPGSTTAHSGSEGLNVNGTWRTPILASQHDSGGRFHLEFEFEGHGDRILGTVAEVTEVAGASNPRSFTTRHPVLEGRIDADLVTFIVTKAAVIGSETVNYTDRYSGLISGELIAFTWQSDAPWGFASRRFTAARQSLPMASRPGA